MDNTPDIERLEPTQQGVSEGTKARKTRKVKKKAAPKKSMGSSASGGFIQNLKIWQKLFLIALVSALPVVAVVSLLANNQNRRIASSAEELWGVEYLVPLTATLKNMQLHRGRSIQQLTGSFPREERLKVAAEVDRHIAALAELDARYGAEFRTTALLEGLTAGWQDLSSNVDQLSPSEAARRHNELLQTYVSPLFYSVGNNAGLLLDPELDSYYIIDLLINQLPSGSEDIGAIRALGTAAAARQVSTPEQKAVLSVRLANARQALANINRSVTFSAQASPLVAEELVPAAEEATELINVMFNAVEEQILGVETATLTVPEYANYAFNSQLAQDRLFENALGVVAELVQERIQSLRRSQFITLFSVAFILVLATMLALFIVRQITRPVSELAAIAERVGQGDLSKFAKVNAKDELGTLANSFNQAIKSLRQASERNESERQQSEQLQRNVGAFLDVAMDIAEGDFTKRGNVTEDVLGNVVDAINLMVEEVAYLLGQTRDAASSVNSGASEMIATTESIAQSAQRQAAEAERARTETEQVTASIRKMAQQADESANASTKALEASRQGESAVQNTLKGMEGIRTEVRSISERTKNLTRRSEEISGIVRSISRIASQTNLLALSASLEAAGAGEAGKRFATVATEVQTLAEDSANAARQVASIIRELQGEINEVAELTESGSKEVEQGYQVATEAGQRLREIAEISTQSAELARFISRATQEQVQGVEGVNEIVQTMTEISQASQGSVTQGRDAAEKLQQLAAQLSESLSRFRLSA